MIQKNAFTGGINSDDEDRLIPNSDYRYALNCTIAQTDNGANFTVSNTQGNTLVAYDLPSGGNTVIGVLRDDKTKSSIYFIHNTTFKHSILQYLWDSNTIVKILEDNQDDDFLGLDLNFKITGVNLVNSELLYWTDDNREPKKINITKAKANGYVLPFVEDYIYAIKRPPSCPPAVEYVNDDTRNVNYLNGFLFQFKYRNIYDDYEKSAYSPISEVPLPVLGCSTFSDELINNGIDITVNTGSSIVTKIEIVGRHGNTGDFFSIVTLDKSDKYNPLASDIDTIFRFFNDKSYLNINIAESNKLYDNVPKKAKSQEIIDPTRIAYGDVLEGFDPVEIVSELNLTVNPQPKIDTYSITGSIIIQNPFVTYTSYQQNQPIYRDISTGATLFGGVTAADVTGASTLNFSTAATYGQTLVAGGFTAYLAGTDYAAISKQAKNANYFQDANTNVIFVTSKTEQKAYAADPHASSTFTISNVPPGKYVLRIAGNATTQSDINDGTRAYQKTSTTTTSVGGTGATEIEVTVTNANVTIGTTIIYDLSFPRNRAEVIFQGINVNETGAYFGYLTDADIFPPVTTTAGLLADERIELAVVNFNTSNIPQGTQLASPTTHKWNGGNPTGSGFSPYGRHTNTDHNGFFFVSYLFDRDPFSTQSVIINGAIVGGITGLRSTNQITAYNSSGGPFTDLHHGGLAYGAILRPSTEGFFDNVRTLITGRVVNSAGIGIKGLSVVIGRGGVESTASNGTYSIFVYANTLYGVIPGTSVRADRIYFASNGTCIGIFTPVNDAFNISFIQNGGTLGQINDSSPYQGVYYYSQTAPVNCEVADMLVDMFGFASSESSLKRGGWYEYGIVYYDHGNRSGLTNTNEMASLTTTPSGNVNGMKLYVPFYTELNPATSEIYGGGTVSVDWKIYNAPPSWATHYQWVRTKNMANNRFIQFAAKGVLYTDDLGNVKGYGEATKLNINVNNINTDYKKINPTSQVYYDWIKTPTTDRLRLIKDSGNNFYDIYFDTAIINYVAGYIVTENSSEFPDLSSQNGFLYEIYNPKLKLEADESLFWEIGECYEVKYDITQDAYYHAGPTQDQTTSYTINAAGQTVSAVPATGTFHTGDTYYRLRNMPVGTTTFAFKLGFIEDSSVSDFYSSLVSDIGRPNKFDPDAREVRRPSTIPYSEVYIPETKINGLNSFYDTSFETYEQKYGSIQKLYNQDHNLVVFQELKVGQIPVNLTVIYDNAGQQVVGASAKVLNKIVYYSGEFGIGKNPESFAVYGLSKYFVDRNRFAVLRLDRNGITPISEYKTHGEFIRFFGEVKGNVQQYFYGTYDVSKKKYVVSREAYQKLVIVPGGFVGSVFFPAHYELQTIAEGKTISFNEATNKWESYYSYLPEFMSGSNADLITFKAGKLWIHNSSVYNNFYGVQYNSQIHTIFNADPSKKKVFKAISEESENIWTAQFETPIGQESNLIEADFEEIEGFQYAAILFDENTPNVADPLNEGDELRDTTLLAKLTNNSTEYVRLFAVNIVYENSERSNK